jgi:drug/metabolite transporter (DMT)-like permease
VVSALVAAALFGATAPLARWLGLDRSPLAGSAVLYGGAGLALLAMLLFGRARGDGRGRTETPLLRADLPLLAAVILVGGLAAPVLLLHGLAHTGATITSLLLNLETPFTAVIATLVFREHLGRRGVAATLGILAGAAWLAWASATATAGSPQGTLAGAAAVAGACACWAVDNNLSARLSLRDPRALVAVKGLGAGGLAALLALASRAPWPPLPRAALGLLLGALGYGTSLLLYVRAQRQLGAARTGALFATGPFLGALGAVAFLGEPARPALGAAALLMAGGVALFLGERHEHEHAHEAAEHDHLHVHDEHHVHEHRGDEGPEPHAHPHQHDAVRHAHPHVSDIHHRHRH